MKVSEHPEDRGTPNIEVICRIRCLNSDAREILACGTFVCLRTIKWEVPGALHAFLSVVQIFWM